MQLQRLATTVVGVDRNGPFQSDAVVDSVVVRANYQQAVGVDQGPFDRAAPSRSRTIRCDLASEGHRRRLMPRSMSACHIDCLAPSTKVTSQHQEGAALARTESSSRFRKRLDAFRGNLVARMTRKRSDIFRAKNDSGGTAKDDNQQKYKVSVVSQPEVSSQTNGNGAETSSVKAVSSPSSPSASTAMFDRRRVQRRTPRRHRTVVVSGEQVQTARGLLSRHASSASSSSSTQKTRQPKVDDVIQHQSPPRYPGNTHQQEANIDVKSTFTDTVNHDDIHQLPRTRSVRAI